MQRRHKSDPAASASPPRLLGRLEEPASAREPVAVGVKELDTHFPTLAKLAERGEQAVHLKAASMFALASPSSESSDDDLFAEEDR
jgi:hypothetical protein